MGFTTAGLTNDGSTAHYKMEYDDSFSVADGRNRTNALLAQCEQDFRLMSSWFAGVEFRVGTPLRVQIVNTFGGASWSGSDITLKPGSGTSVNLLRYLLVSEVTEMLIHCKEERQRRWPRSVARIVTLFLTQDTRHCRDGKNTRGTRQTEEAKNRFRA